MYSYTYFFTQHAFEKDAFFPIVPPWSPGRATLANLLVGWATGRITCDNPPINL